MVRWHFPNAADAAEAAERRAIRRRIQAWWNAFAARADDLAALFSGQSKWDLPQWMQENLGAIHPHLSWEFGTALRGPGDRLVITPESRYNLRPLAGAIVQAAPALGGWEFYTYRPRVAVDDALAMVQGRTGRDASRTRVSVTAGPMNTLSLTYYPPDCDSDEDESALAEALVLTESLLGEKTLDHWVGPIEVSPPAKARGLIALDRLKPTAAALIESIRNGMPAQPWMAVRPRDEAGARSAGGKPHGETINWGTMTFRGCPQRPEYPRRSDLLTLVTPCPDVMKAAHASEAFWSERFSRHREHFCYLKIDGSDELPDALGDRPGLEAALDEALIAAKAGCVLGGGTGVQHSYVDFALVDVRRGVETVRSALSRARVTPQAWIEFFDADLAAEWVGIYDDSPPPPREADEDGADD